MDGTGDGTSSELYYTPKQETEPSSNEDSRRHFLCLPVPCTNATGPIHQDRVTSLTSLTAPSNNPVACNSPTKIPHHDRSCCLQRTDRWFTVCFQPEAGSKGPKGNSAPTTPPSTLNSPNDPVHLSKRVSTLSESSKKHTNFAHLKKRKVATVTRKRRCPSLQKHPGVFFNAFCTIRQSTSGRARAVTVISTNSLACCQ